MNLSVTGTCCLGFLPYRNQLRSHCGQTPTHTCLVTPAKKCNGCKDKDKKERFSHFLFLIATMGLSSPYNPPHAVSLPSPFFIFESRSKHPPILHFFYIPFLLSLSSVFPFSFISLPLPIPLTNSLPFVLLPDLITPSGSLEFSPLLFMYRQENSSYSNLLKTWKQVQNISQENIIRPTLTTLKSAFVRRRICDVFCFLVLFPELLRKRPLHISLYVGNVICCSVLLNDILICFWVNQICSL